jgi:hypothetical protein
VAGYEVLAELGRGGMGVVYKARHRSLHRLVALKMIRSGSLAGPLDLARFRREAEAVARLQHPHIIQIHEIGDYDGLPFFSLEYIEGGSLDQLLKTTRMPGQQAAQLVHQLAQAMHHAHERGVVHRDLKPANILLAGVRGQGSGVRGEADAPSTLTPDPWPLTPKITHFGLAKRLDVEAGHTQSGEILGTPSYMAPEQAMGKKDIGAPADVYALGAILYELLTGEPPFKGPTPFDTLMAVLSCEPRPVRQMESSVPRDLETICFRCLAKEPSQRYASSLDLADDLARFLNNEPIRARRAGLWERSRKWIRRRPAVALGWLLAFLLLAGAGAGYWVWQHLAGQHPEEPGRAAQPRRPARTEYYAHQVNHRGVTIGIDPVTAEQARRRNLTYRFSLRGDRVERIDVVTGYGRLTGRHLLRPALNAGDVSLMLGPVRQRRECFYRYRYDDQGNVLEEEACDAAGRTVWKLHFSSPTTAYFTDHRGFPRWSVK